MSGILNRINTEDTSQEFRKSKKQLSALFAIIVFCIAFFLTAIFLWYKYNISARAEKTQFLLTWDEISKLISSRPGFLESFSEEKGDILPHIRAGSKLPYRRSILYSNFMVADKKSGETLFSNINKDFDIKDLQEMEIANRFTIDNGVMLRIIPLRNQYAWSKLVHFQEVRYDTADLIEDMIVFLIISILSSMIIYLVWYKFVSYNLKPVEENMKDMKQFIHNAGHELKTPLAVVHGNLQILGTIKKKDNSIISESIDEIEKMSEILEWLVELSDIQANKQETQVLVFDELQKCIKVFKHKLQEKDLEIEIKNSHKQYINVYPPYFYIFLTNILSNAIKYSKKWGKIQVIIDKNLFSVIDEGIWIKEEKIKKVFDRFFKAHSDNSYEGSGIWLSLVKKIADIYKWKIDLKSKEGEGTQVNTHF